MSGTFPFYKSVTLPVSADSGKEPTPDSLSLSTFNGLMDLKGSVDDQAVLKLMPAETDDDQSLLKQVVQSLANLQEESDRTKHERDSIIEDFRNRVGSIEKAPTVVYREYNGLSSSTRSTSIIDPADNASLGVRGSRDAQKNITTDRKSRNYPQENILQADSPDQLSPIVHQTINTLDKSLADAKKISVIGKGMRKLMLKHKLFRTASGVFTSLLSKFLNMS